jgi:glycosyltransferase involved in cell wall biosynthesis
MDDGQERIRYTVVVPLYNEFESIMPLYEGIKEVLEGLARPFEVVFVDDGSGDGSLSLLRNIASVDSRVTVVGLRRNQGKSAAVAAGFRAARGRFVITMDGDLQHDPADLPRFVEKLEEGFDIVCGWRNQRSGGILERIFNRGANWIASRWTGVDIHDFGGGFKAYRRDLIEGLPIYGELQRLIPALAFRHDATVCEVPITATPRAKGVSKYGLAKKLPFFFDLIAVWFLLRYLSRPLHAFGTAGVLSATAGFAVAAWLIISKMVYGVSVMQQHGPLMIASAVLIVAGIQLIALGLLAEIQVRHYHQGQGLHSSSEMELYRQLEGHEQ